MDVQTALTTAADTAERARAQLQELCYDPASWGAIAQAGKISPIVDAGLQLQSAAQLLHNIAAAIARQAAELEALQAPEQP